jgi:hypothetical protein
MFFWVVDIVLLVLTVLSRVCVRGGGVGQVVCGVCVWGGARWVGGGVTGWAVVEGGRAEKEGWVNGGSGWLERLRREGGRGKGWRDGRVG